MKIAVLIIELLNGFFFIGSILSSKQITWNEKFRNVTVPILATAALILLTIYLPIVAGILLIPLGLGLTLLSLILFTFGGLDGPRPTSIKLWTSILLLDAFLLLILAIVSFLS